MGLLDWLFGKKWQPQEPKEDDWQPTPIRVTSFSSSPLSSPPPRLPDGWRVSEAGNKTFTGTNAKRQTVRATVFPDDKDGGQRLWKFVVTRIASDGFDDDRHDPFYSDHYYTQEDAMSDCRKYLSGSPLEGRTYQQDRAERIATEVAASIPITIQAEEKNLSDLKARIARGRSKKENLMRDAKHRLKQAQHCRDYACFNGRPSPAQIASFDHIVSSYKQLIHEISKILPKSS